MCCEHLVCAACSGRVVEARCPICRDYRDAHHASSVDWSTLALPLVAALAALLLMLAWYVRVS